MTFSAKPSVVPTSTGHAGATPADPFILTLCRLAAPVTIKPPRAPHLKPFTFFTSRSAQPDGSERLYLHMGYFGSLEQAQKWAQLMRSAYPNATAMRAPAALLRKRDSAVPTLAPPAASEEPLTDTQVLRILDTRRVTPEPADASAEQGTNDISLLRPEDTQVRRLLKDAVVQRAPVSFVVQLKWSPTPIDVRTIPSLSIFKAYTLYSTPGSRDGSWHALRLGFFTDAISAKQVAYYVRSSFESVAVVPITDEERKRGTERAIDVAKLTDQPKPKDPTLQRIDQVLRADSERSKLLKAEPTSRAPAAASAPTKRRKDSLDQTLELLAASEIWNDADSLSETGVRHLKVDVQKRAAKR